MANNNSRRSASSQRSKNILDMIKKKHSTDTKIKQVAFETFRRRNKSPNPELQRFDTLYYNRPYSMTSNIFEKFCDTQITYNSHVYSSILNNWSKDFRITSFPAQRYDALPSQDLVQIDLTCNEVMLPEDQIDITCNEVTPSEGQIDITCIEVIPSEDQIDITWNDVMPLEDLSFNVTELNDISLTMENTSTISQLNLQCDFDSDDSVRDKDYHPSDSSSDSNDDFQADQPNGQKAHVLQANRRSKKKVSQLVTPAVVTKSFTSDVLDTVPFIQESKTLQNKRRSSINFLCADKDTPASLLSRNRRNTIDVGACQSLHQANESLALSLEPETSQPTRKRKKYNIPLPQRIIDTKNKKRLEHNVKTGCSETCLKKCTSKFNQDQREAINKMYWDLSWREKHLFVNAHTSVAVPKRKTTSDPKRKPKRAFTFKQLDDTRVEVCKIFFLTTLGYVKTNDRILHNSFTDRQFTDKRGKHQKTLAYDRDLLTQHVESFHPSEPHYRREHAPLRRYLSSDINVSNMHKHFCEKYPDMIVSYELYRQHVKKMNISFTRLGNEECEMCESYTLHKKETSHDAGNQIVADCTLCVEWAQHHQKYKKARELYNEHKNIPQNDSQIYYSADLEKVIMLPRLETFKAAIFCQRLTLFNQTFAPVGKISSSLKPLTVIWHDAIAGRKQEDIMTAFYHFLLCNRDVTNVNIWLDNCSAQNKNWLLYSLFVHLVNCEIISAEQITLHYFEPGHTFMSADQVHHQVELAMKKKVKLYDFGDFEEAVASINKSKVIVKSLSPAHFLNIPNFISDRRVQNSNPRAYLKNMCQVCFTRNNYDLMYKNDFDDDYKTLTFMNNKYLKNPNLLQIKFRSKPKGIDSTRKNDIIEKLSSIIPIHKQIFWKNLPVKDHDDA